MLLKNIKKKFYLFVYSLFNVKVNALMFKMNSSGEKFVYQGLSKANQ